LGNQPGSRPGANSAIASNTRPGTGTLPGTATRPGASTRPAPGTRPATDNRLPNANQPGRTQIADNRANTNVGDRNRTNIDNRQVGGSREVNVGDVNIGNTVNYSQNRQAWVDNRHATADRVRVNAGDRYANAYRDGEYRRGVVGGYGYYAGWNDLDDFHAWRAPTYAAVGAFCGAALANAQPVYYGYGDGGNVYYEDNTVYVEGQPAGTPEQYAQQALDYVAAAPPADQVPQEEWMPLGVFVLSREDAADSHTMLELAVNKQGVLAGTYYNESTSASRPLKGTVDQKSQRAVVGFADGKNADLALETGIYNLTQGEAPALLHHGTEESTPVLLVRLPAPADAGGN
jgi:hypothetical protein